MGWVEAVMLLRMMPEELQAEVLELAQDSPAVDLGPAFFPDKEEE